MADKFKQIDPKPDFPKLEEEVLKLWEEGKIFEKSLDQTRKGKPFVFYEGPPTANGKPGIHHVEARAFKDLIPRFQTMMGRFVLRKGGWDTHGLPVELEVEKKLGISGKKQIESIKPTVRESIVEFNKLCRESVWAYKEEWERLTKRMGYWVDLENPYITYHNSYIESVWAILKKVWDKDLIYLGHKVVPYCPRCGTALSSHEVAQGYQKVWDTSVYVKFKLTDEENTYFLSWTTTPWTLPGNVALAVGEKIEYVKAKLDQEYFIIAKDLMAKVLGEGATIESEMSGQDLIGKAYEPLFDIASLKSDKSYKVYPANFVTTTDGTGIVHTAVMYGEDDYELGTEIGLPKVHTVNDAGQFNDEVKDLAGLKVKDKETETKILDYLKSKNALLKSEKYEHDYPFCWRCGTALLYYARDSWYIAMSKLRTQLKANNEQINWVPDYIKEGRFGEWLDGVKDWAISRERYWGTPLPFWQCEDCKSYQAVGSIRELGLSKNTFYFMRHGEAENNVLHLNDSWPEKKQYKLTEQGMEQAQLAALQLSKLGSVDMIFASDIYRAKETAEIVGKALGIEVNFDERLRELVTGVFDGKTYEEYLAVLSFDQRWNQAVEGGETNKQVETRMNDFLKEVNEKYQGKRILIVSHGDPLFVLMKHLGSEKNYPQFAQPMEIDVSSIDLHRPYIDDVSLKCEKCGKNAHRVLPVLDVWFDSGAMPYAQWHYPFENKEMIDGDKQFPADFISEAIDQTRGWFYTLLAVSTLLDRGPAYKNVINLGLLLDSKGRKMSKSKGNVINPWEVIDKYGADAVRWFMYSVNQPGDSKSFGERDAEMVLRKNFVILWNVLSFFTTYANNDNWDPSQSTSDLDVLDEWILAKLQDLVNQVTTSLEKFDVFRAARTIEEFIQELSTWYVRRSRERKGAAVYQTLYEVLTTLAKLLAPFTPFIADGIWQVLKTEIDSVSVHLEKWPEQKKLSKGQDEILKQMETARGVVEQALGIRKEKQLKVRQPLSELKYKGLVKLAVDVEKIVAEELNVKKVTFETGEAAHVELVTELTPELKKEGLARELERAVQDMRKKQGLRVGEVINLTYDTKDDELKAAFKLFDTKKTYIKQISEAPGGESAEIDGKMVAITLVR